MPKAILRLVGDFAEDGAWWCLGSSARQPQLLAKHEARW